MWCVKSVPRNPEMGAECYRVSQHWGELPSSQGKPNNESVTVTLSLSPAALSATILWWITQFTETILKLNPVQSFFMWNANFVRLSLVNLLLRTPGAKQFHSAQLHVVIIKQGVHCATYFRWEARAIPNYRRNSWRAACTISVVSGFQASNSLYSSRFCPRCVTGIFWNKHTRFHRLSDCLFVECLQYGAVDMALPLWVYT